MVLCFGFETKTGWKYQRVLAIVEQQDLLPLCGSASKKLSGDLPAGVSQLVLAADLCLLLYCYLEIDSLYLKLMMASFVVASITVPRTYNSLELPQPLSGNSYLFGEVQSVLHIRQLRHF